MIRQLQGVVVCALFALFVLPANATDWAVFTAPDGTWSIDFPAGQKVKQVGSDNVITFSVYDGVGSTYLAQMSQLPKPEEDQADSLFKSGVKNLVNGGMGILSVQRTTYDGHPAQDMEFRTEGGDMKGGDIMWDRAVVVGDREYQLGYVTATDTSKPTHYWASFKLLH